MTDAANLTGATRPCDAIAWLEPLRYALDPQQTLDWAQLRHFDDALTAVLDDHPVAPDLPPGPERSQRLLLIRRALSREVTWPVLGRQLPGQPAFQLAAQFVCGYHDIDLRDAVGIGHGRLIAKHGSAETRQRWIGPLLGGDLAGIAITEPHGGSRVATTQTRAIRRADGSWSLNGRKTWISRLTEASVFIVFYRDPDAELRAAAVDAAEPGLVRQPLRPAGLAGWSWGVLDLHNVQIRPQDVLIGDGMAVLRDHFASYRPLVTATALGGAAALFDTVTTALAKRLSSGDIPRLRDSALVTVGRAHVQLVTALLGTALTVHHAEAGSEQAELWGCATKAHGIDTAVHATAEVALLLGAAGFQADSQITKTRRDLNGLLYADGIHDSLFRAAGKAHIQAATSAPEPPMPPPPRRPTL